MKLLRCYARKAKLHLLESVHAKRIVIGLDKPVFSFTFDDYDIDTYNFWGFDFGYIIPLKGRNGIEIEINIKYI